jgi:GNAT superfamily N-acetyltransferase
MNELLQAEYIQLEDIWYILKEAIIRRKVEGSNQWQDGYPNKQTILEDIDQGVGYVLLNEKKVVAYLAIKVNDEPAYNNIVGNWLNNNDFLVIHRVAVHPNYLGKGLATKLFHLIENHGVSRQVFDVKVDTNFDNKPMLSIFKRLDYVYCGKVYFDGSERLAFQKKITYET